MVNNKNINTDIEELIIPNNTGEIKDFQYSNYPNLKKVVIPDSVTRIGNNAFYNCPNLIAVKLPNGLKFIGKGAFQNCPKLKYIKFPETLEIIENDAFNGCSSIEKIYIPSNLKKIGSGAFHKTSSCEKIEISRYNKKYQVFENIALIDIEFQQKLVLYAGGCKNSTFDFTKYCASIMNGNEVITEVKIINQYALCGNPYLKRLILPSCLNTYEKNAFKDCSNLKYLDINGIEFFPIYNVYIEDNNNYLIADEINSDEIFPFEHLTINGYIYEVKVNFTSKPFKNLKTINIQTSTICTISQNSFFELCPNLQVYFKNNPCNIEALAFNKSATIILEDGQKMQNIKSRKIYNEQLGTYMLYTLYDSEDGNYIIDFNKQKYHITNKQIKSMCKKSEIIVDSPTLFLDFLLDMKNHKVDDKILLNGIIIKYASKETKEMLFDICEKKDDFSKKVLEKSKLFETDDEINKFLLSNGFERIASYISILKSNNITDEIFYDRLFITTSKYVDYDYLFKNHYRLLKKIITLCKFTNYRFYSDEFTESKYVLKENSNKMTGNNILDKVFYNDNLTKYIKLIAYLNIKNKIIFNESIIASIDNILMIKFLIMMDSNLERLLKASKVLDKQDTATQNISDLLNLLHITNALDTNPIYRQKICTFLTEKIFSDTLGNGQMNENQIVGDNIHRMFAFTSVKAYSDKNFSTLFLENYQDMLRLEKIGSGTINDIYENFEDISKTNTSDKGMQRQLKVTLDKCIHYLSSKKFENIPEGFEEMALTIGKWYRDNTILQRAIKIHEESLDAPRNIFTKKTFINGNTIYDNNPSQDLKESLSEDFSYEWLIKQDYDNLILGKYCNCCSHLNGMGQGIMRASVISPDCQNLVIRDKIGEIISKATIYVNGIQGYAVFNTIETRMEYRRNPDSLEKIYNTLIRGTEAFVDKYNQNNPGNEINTVTIGTKGNSLNNLLKDNQSADIYTYRAPQYSIYSITPGFTYNGDCHDQQKILLKK